MTQMVERAAKALEVACNGDVTRLPIPNPRTWDTPMSAIGVTSKDAARAALLAALDLSEAEITAIVGEHNSKGGWLIDADELRACAAALKAWTQGETAT